jgi:hypothetical protein
VFSGEATNTNIIIFDIKPVSIKKDDRDKRSLLIFSFVTEKQ